MNRRHRTLRLFLSPSLALALPLFLALSCTPYSISRHPAVRKHPGRAPALHTPVSRGFASAESVRVLLARPDSALSFSSLDSLDLHTSAGTIGLPGEVSVSITRRGRVAVAGRSVAPPCTLVARHGQVIALGPNRYRGLMAITASGAINIVGLEDYLRGVVPLEMGKRSWSELEALKAQAVAARTYALKRRAGRKAASYDLAATVADQVYGGVDAEAAEADSAVSATLGLVLTHHDSLATVFFHSTCGGQTAAVDEVWNRPPCDYLRSESDTGPNGRAWCEFAPHFEWQERWDADTLAAIVRHTSAALFPGRSPGGKLRKVTIVRRFGDGRVAECRLAYSRGTIVCGGDKLRFLLRREDETGPILRSANFLVEENGPYEFVLRGRGYGHGVGMCQMGAVGRARNGQGFEEILAAYFHETRVERWDRGR